MKNIIMGIELECIVNISKRNVVRASCGSVEVNKGLAGWKVTSDGSVRTMGEWTIINPVISKKVLDSKDSFEFISQKISGKKMFLNVMNNFKRFISCDGKFELNEVVSFNNSCGAHVHFSIKGFKFKDKTFYLIYPKIRKYFFDKMKASNVSSKEEILNHYFRGYAKRFQKSYMKGRERRAEFNFLSERENTGLEWRSINLLNIKTWKEFDEMMEIIWSCLECLYKECTNWKTNLIVTRTDEMIKKTFSAKVNEMVIDLNKVKQSERKVKI